MADMRVLVSGSHGLIGNALVCTLRTRGYEVGRLVRRHTKSPAGPADVSWDLGSGTVDTRAMEGADALVHLAGASLARRWSSAHRERVRDSRVDGTSQLASALAHLDRPPAVMVSGSAIGYYGDRGDEEVTEDSEPGTGFLADLVRAWEAATAPAEKVGIRVVHLRSGRRSQRASPIIRRMKASAASSGPRAVAAEPPGLRLGHHGIHGAGAS